eukprot:TRINITY_DN4076_c0_g2_i10.p1 TRINITY_DN4076_c0_g2~~TRINITY_DN4076_c0_g2_i10.p1  ORF type:complete len:270 (+),score=64.60 TRINITY_DN4076_c0_g2_i10:40-849(+)
MADRAQGIQRNLYHQAASEYRVDGRKTYGNEYMRRLAFVPSDLPPQAQKNNKFSDRYDSLHPTAHLGRDLGRTGGAVCPRSKAQRISSYDFSRPGTGGKTLTLASTIYLGPESLTTRRSPVPQIPTTLMSTNGGLVLTQRTSPRNVHMPVGFRRAPAVPRSDQERLANDCFITKQYKRAADYLSLAIAVDPNNASLYAKRAAAKAHLGLFAEAHDDTRSAVTLNPSSSKARFRLKAVEDYVAKLKDAPPGWDGGHMTCLLYTSPSPRDS